MILIQNHPNFFFQTIIIFPPKAVPIFLQTTFAHKPTLHHTRNSSTYQICKWDLNQTYKYLPQLCSDAWPYPIPLNPKALVLQAFIQFKVFQFGIGRWAQLLVFDGMLIIAQSTLRQICVICILFNMQLFLILQKRSNCHRVFFPITFIQ